MFNLNDYEHKIADESDDTKRVIERITWQINVMREKPSNRIADTVTLNARDVEALIEAARRNLQKGD